MLARARTFFTAVFTPLARLLLRAGIAPNAVTAVGTIAVCATALVLFPIGQLFWGSLVITVFVISDTVDGVMARMSGRSSTWGAFLDSTLDRFGDAAIFGGLLLWFTRGGDDPVLAAVTLWCLVTGSVTSYIRARAEALGMTAEVGISQRADRLVAVLVGAGLSGLGVPFVLPVLLWLLAAASGVTVVQRLVVVRRQARARAPAEPAREGSDAR
jgi:CDP-diacylglycerol--glycerol-3-phosphate 3-phosphatidyltransferase